MASLPRKCSARSFSCASRTGIIANCKSASTMASRCAALPSLTASPFPKHDAFNRAFNRLTPETLRDINQLVVKAAVHLGLEDGKTLRVDTTVVESNIHYPTDATLLWDSVRTITRLIGDLHEKLPDGVQGFTNRTRSARRRMQPIQRMT